MSPSLALLNFEQSPSDKPMFDLTMHQRSASGSSLEVHHSSPMTVPDSARQMTPYNIFPASTDLPAGTVPDTPGPMQRAFNRDPVNHAPWQYASPTPMERYAPSTPVLTPLPGTNLSIGDVDPELVPLPPSVNPSTVRLGHDNPGYFDTPVDEQPQMDSTDMLNGLACLKLADQHNDTLGAQSKPPSDVAAETPVGHRGTAKERRHQYEDAKLQDTVNTLDIPQDRTRPHRRTQQVKDLQENVRVLGVPKHHQVLPLRPKQQDEDLQDRVRKDSCINEDWETCSGVHLTSMASESVHGNRNQNLVCETSPSSIYSTFAPPKKSHGTVDGNDSPVDFAYIVWESPNGQRQRSAPENTWGRHTGLYDGTGYGDDSVPSTPREPDEGIQDVHLKAWSAPLSVDGGCSGQKISNRPSRDEDPYPESVRESPFTVHEQRNYESLESIYRAYAYPLGGRVPSSSNSSAGGDVQLPATKKDEISS